MPDRNPPANPRRIITRGQADRLMMRAIMDMNFVWMGCYRACRRKKGCASPDVGCFDHNIERVRDFTFRLAHWRRLDGPRELAELVEPVDDFLD